MKAIKAIAALILTLCILLGLLWISVGGGISAVLSAKTVDSILESADVAEIVRSAAGSSVDDLDEFTFRLLETSAVRYYVDDFAQDYIKAILYGDAMPVITEDGLTPVLYSALDELEGGELTELEALSVEGLRLVVPQLASSFAAQAGMLLPTRSTLLSQIGLTEEGFDSLATLIGSSVRTGLLVVCIVLALIVFFLYLKRCRWAIWLGAAMIVPGVVCTAAALFLSGKVNAVLAEYQLESVTDVIVRPFLFRGVGLLCLAMVLFIIAAVGRSAHAETVPAAAESAYVPKHRK